MSKEQPKLVPFPVKPAVEPPTLPADLQNQVDTIRAFATVHNLLTQAHFPVGLFPAVAESIQFLKACHGQAVLKASDHPESHLVPEIKAFMETVKEAEKAADKAREEEPKDGQPEEK